MEVNTLAKQVAKAIEKVIPCKRIGVAVIGLEVPHAHMHLVPLNTIGDINFKSARVNLTPEEFAKIAECIRENL